MPPAGQGASHRGCPAGALVGTRDVGRSPVGADRLAGSRSSRTDAIALPRGRRGFKGHRLPVLRVASKLGTHGRLCVRARLKAPRGFCGLDDPELRRGGALWIAGLLTPLSRATARDWTTRGEADALANRREWAFQPARRRRLSITASVLLGLRYDSVRSGTDSGMAPFMAFRIV
jgi:hypothetical protein